MGIQKELEEAIERLDRFITIRILYGNTFVMHLEQLNQIQKDIETVLKALDNSISKEVIEDKIEKYKKMADDFYARFIKSKRLNMEIRDAGFSCDRKIEALKELLEG